MTRPYGRTGAAAYPAPDDKRSLGELVLLVATELRDAFARAAAAEGLTFAEAQALRLLARAATQKELVDILAADPSRVSALMRRLESAGLIRRTWGRGDRRVRETELTPEGAAAVVRIVAHLDAHSPLMNRLDEAERDHLGTVLRKLAGLPD